MEGAGESYNPPLTGRKFIVDLSTDSLFSTALTTEQDRPSALESLQSEVKCNKFEVVMQTGK